MLQMLKDRIADLLLPAKRQVSDLDRSIAEAGTAHLAARRALALATAEEEREVRRRDAMLMRVADLEARAVEALTGGRDDLAARAAEAIAALETEVAASKAASERFAVKVARTRRAIDDQRRRLADLDRGRRLARVDATITGPASAAETLPPLERAEAALGRVEAFQEDAEAVRAALAPPAETLADDMAEAGFGRPTRVLAADVMTRLRALAPPRGLIEQVALPSKN